jgi:hypothetical protein
MADLGRGHERTARRRRFDGFADLPRAAHLLGLALQVAASHVEADCVTIDAVERLLGRDVGATLGERDDELDLVVHVARFRRIREAAVADDVVRVLLEEEWRLAVGIVAHLDGVLGIVAADAIDAADGEHLIATGDRQGRDRGRLDHVVRHLGLHVHCLTPA